MNMDWPFEHPNRVVIFDKKNLSASERMQMIVEHAIENFEELSDDQQP